MAALSLQDLITAGKVWHTTGPGEVQTTPTWSLATLAGRYVELTARGPAARLTLAGALLLEAQLAREPAAWISAPTSTFFAPDLARNGVDVGALVVVRAPTTLAMLRAADTLLRAGAFGLVVVDFESAHASDPIPLAAQTRLVGLAQHHQALLLCLTRRGETTAPGLASLRVEASLVRAGSGRFESRLEAVKDKRGSPGWRQTTLLRTVPGLG